MTNDSALTTYIAVTLRSSSPFFNNPAGLANAHNAITHVGQVGELPDTQLVSIPTSDWANVKDDVLESLKRQEGVARVDVQVPKQRAKRDEL